MLMMLRERDEGGESMDWDALIEGGMTQTRYRGNSTQFWFGRILFVNLIQYKLLLVSYYLYQVFCDVILFCVNLIQYKVLCKTWFVGH